MNPDDIPNEPGFARSLMIFSYWLYQISKLTIAGVMIWIAVKLWAL